MPIRPVVLTQDFTPRKTIRAGILIENTTIIHCDPADASSYGIVENRVWSELIRNLIVVLEEMAGVQLIAIDQWDDIVGEAMADFTVGKQELAPVSRCGSQCIRDIGWGVDKLIVNLDQPSIA